MDGVFTYSAISGILLSVFIHTGLDVSETGIAMQILTIISNALGSPNSYLIPIVSILVTIIEILVMIHYIRQITDHGLLESKKKQFCGYCPEDKCLLDCKICNFQKSKDCKCQ